MANRGIRCFLADYSVDAPPVENDLFDFEKKFLGITEDPVHMTLKNWTKRKAGDETDLILQMDIEGAEYSVILDAERDIIRNFRIIVIEFHRLDALFENFGFEIIHLTFRRLLADFEIVHIHPNNCYMPKTYKGYEIPPVTEFTFLRKDRISNSRPTRTFPHELDQANVPYHSDYALPNCWY